MLGGSEATDSSEAGPDLISLCGDSSGLGGVLCRENVGGGGGNGGGGGILFGVSTGGEGATGCFFTPGSDRAGDALCCRLRERDRVKGGLFRGGVRLIGIAQMEGAGSPELRHDQTK